MDPARAKEHFAIASKPSKCWFDNSELCFNHHLSRFELTHISTGDLLRDEVRSKSAKGVELQEIMSLGKLVPNIEILNLLKKTIANTTETKGFLIDGYPRQVNIRIVQSRQCLTCSIFTGWPGNRIWTGSETMSFCFLSGLSRSSNGWTFDWPWTDQWPIRRQCWSNTNPIESVPWEHSTYFGSPRK